MTSKTKKICLWATPRNISTALMYSFAQRPDTQVVDEPFYGYYLKNTEAKNYHPMAKEVMQSMACSAQTVIQQLESAAEKPVLFIKNMTHHMVDLPFDFAKNLHHVILTRSPKSMIHSFSKVIPNPTIYDLGYKQHLYLKLQLQNNHVPFQVVNADDILMDPQKTLSELCLFLNIPFYPEMLEWNKGPIPEDGIWAKHWYANVHQSEGFKPYQVIDIQLPEHLLPLQAECNAYFKEIISQ